MSITKIYWKNGGRKAIEMQEKIWIVGYALISSKFAVKIIILVLNAYPVLVTQIIVHAQVMVNVRYASN